MNLVQHGKARERPPAITDIFFLLRPTVQPAILELSLAEPGAQLVLLDEVKSASNGESCQTCKDLAGMGLGTRAGAVSAVEILARLDVLYCLVDIDQME